MPEDKQQEGAKQTYSSSRTWADVAAANRAADQPQSRSTPTTTGASVFGNTNPLAQAVINKQSSTTTSTPSYSGGTYYSGTGTYVSPSGQGYSMAQAPSGSTIVTTPSTTAAQVFGGTNPLAQAVIDKNIGLKSQIEERGRPETYISTLKDYGYVEPYTPRSSNEYKFVKSMVDYQSIGWKNIKQILPPSLGGKKREERFTFENPFSAFNQYGPTVRYSPEAGAIFAGESFINVISPFAGAVTKSTVDIFFPQYKIEAFGKSEFQTRREIEKNIIKQSTDPIIKQFGSYSPGIGESRFLEEQGKKASKIGQESYDIEFKRQQEEINQLGTRFQERVTSGELTVEQATLLYESSIGLRKESLKSFGEEINKSMQESYQISSNLGLASLGEFREKVSKREYGITTTGKLIETYAPTTLETASLIGISIASPAVGTQLAIGLGGRDIVLGGIEQDVSKVIGGSLLAVSGGISAIRLNELETAGFEAMAQNRMKLRSFQKDIPIKGVEVRFTGKKSESFITMSREGLGFQENIKATGTISKKGLTGFKFKGIATSEISGTFTYEPVSSKYIGLKLKPQQLQFTQETKGILKGVGTGIGKGEYSFVISKSKFQPMASTSTLVQLDQRLSLFKKEYLSQREKNFEFFYKGEKLSKGYASGFTKKINENIYLSKFGDIKGITKTPSKIDTEILFNKGSIKISENIQPRVDISSDMKNLMLTRVYPKSSFRPETTISFGGGGEEGIRELSLKQFKVTGTEPGQLVYSAMKKSPTKLLGDLRSTGGLIIKQGFVNKDIYAKTFKGVSLIGKQTSTTNRLSRDIQKSFIPTRLMRVQELELDTSKSVFYPRVSSTNIITPSTTTRQSLIPALNISQIPKSDFKFEQPYAPSLTPRTIIPRGESSFFNSFAAFGLPLGLPFAESGTPKKKKKAKRKKGKITPSFTAEVFNIRGALPKGGAFGITPFQFRPIPY